MMRRAFFSRETCAWEIPISSATSICVFPSKKRREMISCSRALSFFNASDKDRCSTQFSPGSFIPNLIHHIERVSSVQKIGSYRLMGFLDVASEGIDNILPGDADLGGNLGDGRLLLVLF